MTEDRVPAIAKRLRELADDHVPARAIIEIVFEEFPGMSLDEFTKAAERADLLGPRR